MNILLPKLGVAVGDALASFPGHVGDAPASFPGHVGDAPASFPGHMGGEKHVALSLSRGLGTVFLTLGLGKRCMF